MKENHYYRTLLGYFHHLSEGFGYPLVESMACSVPIVSSDTPILREVTDGSAVLTDPSPLTRLLTQFRIE